MPSRAEIRVRVEQVLRGIVIAVLGVMLWQSLREQTDSRGRNVNARGVNIGALAEWSGRAKAPARIHVQLDSVPSRIDRAWLGALAGAGSAVSWSGDLAPVMIDAQPVASPSGGTKVLVAAPTGSSVVVSDDVGPIDTVRAQSAGAMLSLDAAPDRLTAREKTSTASTGATDAIVLHNVLVIANAGWESKFAVAALEEEGWKVDASIRVAPGVDVTQGSVATIDTSRYSVVVALDGASSPYASRIVAFAQMGGGVVLASQAASLDAMASLRVGTVGRAEARPSSASGSISLATVALTPITSLRSDAVVVERRGGTNALVARRIGAGRVLQSGYEDTWRLRTGGGDNAVRDHRQLWTGIVSRVAYAPRSPHMGVTETALNGHRGQASEDQAPMVGLVATLGPNAQSGAAVNLPGGQSGAMLILFSLLALALIGEVGSRRLRGAS
jgi:hypothetical protein